jgi:two-component system sensor histidine kinase RegB
MRPKRLPAQLPQSSASDPHAVHRLNAGWIVRLRWAAIAGQALTIGVVHWSMGITLPLVPLALLIALGFASNVLAAMWLRSEPPVTEAVLGASMALDLCLFTGLLYFTGGPFNPFSTLYLVHIALAALVLTPRWTWSLVLLAVAANAALFVRHEPLPIDHGDHGATAHGSRDFTTLSEPHATAAHRHDAHEGHGAPSDSGHDGHHGAGAAVEPGHPLHEPLGMHLQGMWVAFGVTAGFIVYFLNRVSRTLAERDEALNRIREKSAKAERLASVATLAAGAAHELSTPLSTIAVVAKELERDSAARTRDDAQLIRAEVERCRDILRQMAGDAGESPAETASKVTLRELVDVALDPIGHERIRITWAPRAEGAEVLVPLRAASQALRNVIQNAIDASPESEPVDIYGDRAGDRWVLAVVDHGHGMDEGVVARAADPFFTTKEPGRGMGLGLFLTRSVLDFLGGSIDIDSTPGKGTRVTLTFPAFAVREPGGSAT